MERIYMCIDLKSFYASVECVERGLDPLHTNLVVADATRTQKTICLAVSPALKKYGISGRARLFEVISKVKELNNERRRKNHYKMSGKSFYEEVLDNDLSKEISFIAATPRMKLYMKYSTQIYNIYLKYLSSEDIYVYSIDEVFCDLTNYLKYYKLTPEELTTKMIEDVYKTTGITATAGIGTNMYLAKVAMDIVAKHCEPNEIGVRMARLDEKSYREKLWTHKPLTSFWRVGPGLAKRLEENGMYTMGDVALCSVKNEELLYSMFGINAELLIDHAWGYEPVTIKDVKAYKPGSNSISTGQVLHCAYDYVKTRLIIKEMVEVLSLDLVARNLITDQIVLTIGYDVENITNPNIRNKYHGEVTLDHYGRTVPKHAHGTINLKHKTSSYNSLLKCTLELFERIINAELLVRRINICANNVIDASNYVEKKEIKQIDLFTNVEEEEKNDKITHKREAEDTKLQHVLVDIKNKYGKNAILKGMNLQEGGTQIERNGQVGGHKG